MDGEAAPAAELAPEPSPDHEEQSPGIGSRAIRIAQSNFPVFSAAIVTAIVILALALRLYRLEDVPAAMWGDVIAHYSLAWQVLHGHPYLSYYFGGDGPMFSYFAAGLSLVFGLSFFTLKLATALLGTVLTLVVYFLAKELFNRRGIAYVACFLTAVSFWTLSFSRQAKPYGLVPIFVALCVLFALRNQRILAGVALGLGMYTQAAFWGMPLVFLAAIPAAIPTLLVGGIIAAPVLLDFVQHYHRYFGGSSYIGEKLGAKHLTAPDLALRVLDNFWRNLLSFNFKGDIVFRQNIVSHPSLDLLSGFFFLLGAYLILERTVRERNRRLLRWLILPFFLVQVPSVLDTHPLNVPNMGRMLGVTPFVCVTIAYAICEVARWIRSALRRWPLARRPIAGTCFAGILTAILIINFYNFFTIYPRGLPNRNTAFDKVIAQRIDAYPLREYVVLAGCCWGQWAQPEPGSVQDRLGVPRNVLYVQHVAKITKPLLTWIGHTSQHVGVIAPPNEKGRIRRYVPFRGKVNQYMLRKNGWAVAWVAEGTVRGRS